MVTLPSRAPTHWMSWVGIVMAVVAGVLALYGAIAAEKHIAGSPLRVARGNSNGGANAGPWYDRVVTKGEVRVFGDRLDRKLLAITERSKNARNAIAFVAFVLPVFMGSGAALFGGWAMKAVQASGGRYSGNTMAVFSMLIGGLAAVTSACMLVSFYIWPNLPSVYP